MPAGSVLRAATSGGADCMKLPDLMDLKAGQTADIIMVDMSKPSMQPIVDVIPNLVYSGAPDIVKMTMCNGKILYHDGEYETIDLAKVTADSNALLGEMR
jgi:5-methylthioadenosine/S-adenosylhomocysteine deaminase